MYDPAIGRWLSEDPIGFDAADSNLFRYNHNDPVNRTDPSGLQENPLDRFPPRRLERMMPVEMPGDLMDPEVRRQWREQLDQDARTAFRQARDAGLREIERARELADGFIPRPSNGGLEGDPVIDAIVAYLLLRRLGPLAPPPPPAHVGAPLQARIGALQAQIAHQQWMAEWMRDHGMREQAMAHATEALRLAQRLARLRAAGP